MDQKWIQNLASATFTNGQWQVHDSEHLREQIKARLEESLGSLYDDANEAARVFNMYASKAKQIRVFKLTHIGTPKACGFALVMGVLQIKCELDPVALGLKTEAVLLNGAQTKVQPMRQYQPEHDGLGGVSWREVHGATLADANWIIKTLLADLCKLAYESGYLA